MVLHQNRWDYGSGHCAPLGFDLSLGLVPNHVMSILGNGGEDPHCMQGCHTWGLGTSLRKLH